MTEYFLTMPHDTAEEPTMADMDPDELAAVMVETQAFHQALVDSGAFVYSAGLHPPSSAKTIDGTGDEVVVENGPFVDADQYVGGFWVIKADDEAAAVDWATRAAKALKSRIEVRAVQEIPEG